MPAVFELAPGEPRGFRMGSGAPQATIDCADYEMSTPPSGRSYVLSNQPVQELLHLSHCCRMWGECRRLACARRTVASNPGELKANLFGVDRLIEDVGNELVAGLRIVLVVIAAQCKFIA